MNSKIIKTVTRNPNNAVSGGHTRIPSYAMGKTGVICSYCGTHVFPDKNAHDYGENPLPLYTVEFQGSELWSSSSENNKSTAPRSRFASYSLFFNGE